MIFNKTFRLFISSTFDDFCQERDILRKEVFPEIKKYCTSRGFSFQPIDLRWGITNEAQLNQRTKELCINEVRTCKLYPHPNFLLMLGDRYGWVPLPNMIEKEEFVQLCHGIAEKDKYLLKEWYIEDLNQIPVSYILKERRKEATNHKDWLSIESKLRFILQNAAELMLNDIDKRKYFISLTEAELEEGIIPYLGPTKFQNKLLQENPELELIDGHQVFGFLRNVDPKSIKSSRFIGDDFENAKALKKRVNELLLPENLLNISTVQKNKDTLQENYLQEFAERVIYFLKRQIDVHLENLPKIIKLEEEINAQYHFALQKREYFVGRVELLKMISNYIYSKSTEPLIIHGKSGLGKSALIAQAVEQTKIERRINVCYRFVGATANSGTSKEILSSIFKELGIKIDIPVTHKINVNNNKQESFEDFSIRVHDAFSEITEQVVIFIDAVDQLSNSDQFIWLPKKLPVNVKIVLSVLNDVEYPEDSEYFDTLQNKTKNVIEVDYFDQPLLLLDKLLLADNRRLSKTQKEYFLSKYHKVRSPLFIKIVVQELKEWRSFDNVSHSYQFGTGDNIKYLADSKTKAISNYIEKLNNYYNVSDVLIDKTLRYILLSKNGLSEVELLELFSSDELFVKQVAPETFHQNITKELPEVIWIRLFYQLKPFLKIVKQNNQLLYKFFHREFENYIIKAPRLKSELYNFFIGCLQIIDSGDWDDFYQNSWGELMINAIGIIGLIETTSNVRGYCKAITSITNESWLNLFLVRLSQEGMKHLNDNYFKSTKAFFDSSLFMLEILYEKDQKKWADGYITALNNLGLVLGRMEKKNDSLTQYQKSLEILEQMYLLDAKKWATSYALGLNNLGLAYFDIEETEQSLIHLKKSLNLRRKLYELDMENGVEDYVLSIISFSQIYSDIEKNKDAIKLLESSLKILKPLYVSNKENWFERYTYSLERTAIQYIKLNQTNKAIKLLEESQTIIYPFYKKNKKRWIKDYLRIRDSLVKAYEAFNKDDDFIISLKETNYDLTKKMYVSHPIPWVRNYVSIALSLALSYKKRTSLINRAQELEKEVLKIMEELYQIDPDNWAHHYYLAINALGVTYLELNLEYQTLKLNRKSLEIMKVLYDKSPRRWISDYHTSINNLANSYLAIGDYNKSNTLFKKNFDLIEKEYFSQSERWTEAYILSLNNLALSYLKLIPPSNKEGVEAFQKCLEILMLKFRETPNRWFDLITKTLENINALNIDISKIANSEKLEETKILIFEIRYAQNNEKWALPYSNYLNNLALKHHKEGEFKKCSILYGKSLDILRNSFNQNSESWCSGYLAILTNLALSFDKSGKINDMLEVIEGNTQLLKKLVTIDSEYWFGIYNKLVTDLAFAYSEINQIEDALIYFAELKGVLTRLYGADSSSVLQVNKIMIYLHDKMLN
ncbi:tetratricopeptide repeat protein [Aquimarina megaterium]|uniref:tetratricopeptide repeat protein n=1 Tax=Aquimarina megaterium TaxID=1443666 RepID=UPI0009426627|nr:tetratricopeptide repeat protein [Aquimarina megaterium]